MCYSTLGRAVCEYLTWGPTLCFGSDIHCFLLLCVLVCQELNFLLCYIVLCFHVINIFQWVLDRYWWASPGEVFPLICLKYHSGGGSPLPGSCRLFETRTTEFLPFVQWSPGVGMRRSFLGRVSTHDTFRVLCHGTLSLCCLGTVDLALRPASFPPGLVVRS